VSDELRAAAQRVTGYVRAWQLLSNTDNERLGEVTIMLNGWQDPAGPQMFELLAADLEALALHALGGTSSEYGAGRTAAVDYQAVAPFRCTKRVPDPSGMFPSLECGFRLSPETGTCPRPAGEHIG